MTDAQYMRWAECAYAAFSMLNVVFFIGVLIKTPFHYGCKIFLMWNAVGLLLLGTGHLGMVVHEIKTNAPFDTLNSAWVPVLMLHEQAYSFCVFGMFCLIIERLLVTIWPQAFSDQTARKVTVFCVGSAIVLTASTFCTYYLQFGETFGVIVFAHSILELITVMVIFHFMRILLAIICIFASKYKYRVTLAKTTLNSRYRVDEVIEMTWILFPLFLLNFIANMLTSGSAFAFLRVDVTTFNFQKVLSMVCTTSGLVQPWYLLLRQRFLSRRLYSLFHYEHKRSEQVEARLSTVAVTDSYFSMLNRSWAHM